MTEDFLAVVREKRFLGREFLTWLVHRIEDGEARVAIDGQLTELQLGDRLVLAGVDDKDRLTLVGPGDVRAELGAALRRGKLVDRARVVLVRGDRRWELTIDGGMLSFEAVRCPALGPRDAAATDDPRAAFENDLYLRLADLEDALTVLDTLFADFCRARSTSTWPRRVLPALRTWAETL